MAGLLSSMKHRYGRNKQTEHSTSEPLDKTAMNSTIYMPSRAVRGEFRRIKICKYEHYNVPADLWDDVYTVLPQEH